MNQKWIIYICLKQYQAYEMDIMYISTDNQNIHTVTLTDVIRYT